MAKVDKRFKYNNREKKLTIRVPREIFDEYEQKAKEKNISKQSLFDEIFDEYKKAN